jgi:hypothetical protein
MDQQNSSNEVVEIDKAIATLGKAPVDFVITPQMQAWIDYNAVSGIITDNLDESQTIRKMSISEFANTIGVHRDTLRNWRTYIPNFWDRVNERRKELAPRGRLQYIHEKWYIEAAKMEDWRITEAWLRNHDPDYKEARQKVEHELGDGLADALNIARERRMKSQTVVEGEVVDGTTDA